MIITTLTACAPAVKPPDEALMQGSTNIIPTATPESNPDDSESTETSNVSGEVAIPEMTPQNILTLTDAQKQAIVDKYSSELKGYQAINPDVTAILQIPNLGISQPVVKSVMNDQYLRQALNGTYSKYGTLFFDQGMEDFNDRNLIIYGHNTDNGSMFAPLPQTTDQAVFDQTVALLITDNFVYFYLPYAVYETKDLDRYIQNNPESLTQVVVEDSLTASTYASILSDTQMLTLSTRYTGSKADTRFVLQFLRV